MKTEQEIRDKLETYLKSFIEMAEHAYASRSE